MTIQYCVTIKNKGCQFLKTLYLLVLESYGALWELAFHENNSIQQLNHKKLFSINKFWENGEVFLNYKTFCWYSDFLSIVSLIKGTWYFWDKLTCVCVNQCNKEYCDKTKCPRTENKEPSHGEYQGGTEETCPKQNRAFDTDVDILKGPLLTEQYVNCNIIH